MVTSPPGPLSLSRRGGTKGKVGQRVRSYFSSMSCGRPAPVGKWSKSTSNFSSSVIPWGPTLSSRTRNGTLPSRLESSELLTYSRRLSGVSFIMFGSSSFTSLMNFGCKGSDTSYCCTALPANRRRTAAGCRRRSARSEEHTSELQSQSNLVCRLLLEKKKKKLKDM